MTNKAHKPPTVVEQTSGVTGGVSALASANAPFIYFDGVSNYGVNSGVANLTLEVVRFSPTQAGGGVVADRVTVAHLRMTLEALHSLKSAIEGIERMAQPARGGTRT